MLLFIFTILFLCSIATLIIMEHNKTVADNHQSTSNQSAAADAEHVSLSTVSVKIPKFNKSDPRSFFIIVESSFAKSRITTQLTKAHHLISGLDVDLIPHIRDIIVSDIWPDNVYDQIKERLINGFAISSEERTCY